jgi:glycosyltransferase involved in cell wall biosynthesis
MRILTVISTLTRGGTERTAVNYAMAYKRRGVPSAVLAYGGGGCREEMLQDAGIELFLGGKKKQHFAEAVRQSAGWSPTVVHLHRNGEAEPFTSEIISHFALQRKCKIIETNVFSRPDYSKTAQHIDVHMHLTNWCLWKWQQLARRIEPKPIGTVVPYGIEVETFKSERTAAVAVEMRRSLCIPERAFLIGRVGQPLSAKWSPLLIDAFEGAAANISELHLVTIGAPDNVMKRIAALPPRLRDRVVSLPTTDCDKALKAFYSSLDVFVHASSKGESFGHVLCEAMLSGTPVITLSTPLKDNSQLEIVQHEIGGLVARDWRGMRDAILRLHGDKDLWGRLSHGARASIESRFSTDHVISRLLELTGIVSTASNRDALRRLLNNGPNNKTSIALEEIFTLLKRSNAYPSFLTRLGMRMLHEPKIRNIVDAVRRRL